MSQGDYIGLPGWRGGDANAAYLDKNLRHTPIELSLDDSVSWRALLQLAAYAVLASVVVFLPIIFFGLFLALVGSLEGLGVMYVLANFAAGIAFWVTLLGMRLAEPIAEWRVLLADRQGSKDSVYVTIAGTLQRRQIPIASAERLIATELGGQAKNRLVLTEGKCQAYVSVFGYGTSLYLGWQMWRSRRGYALIGQFVADLVASITGRSGPERTMMRTEGVRAMREAVHAACREGLATAMDGVEVPVSYAFPQGLPPVGHHQSKAAPVPGLGTPVVPAPAAPWGPGSPPPQTGDQQQH